MKTLNKIQKYTEINQNRQVRQIFSVVYPGLSLGIQFFCDVKVKRQLGSGGLGYRDKAPKKNCHIYIQRVVYMPECYLS